MPRNNYSLPEQFLGPVATKIVLENSDAKQYPFFRPYKTVKGTLIRAASIVTAPIFSAWIFLKSTGMGLTEGITGLVNKMRGRPERASNNFTQAKNNLLAAVLGLGLIITSSVANLISLLGGAVLSIKQAITRPSRRRNGREQVVTPAQYDELSDGAQSAAAAAVARPQRASGWALGPEDLLTAGAGAASPEDGSPAVAQLPNRHRRPRRATSPWPGSTNGYSDQQAFFEATQPRATFFRNAKAAVEAGRPFVDQKGQGGYVECRLPQEDPSDNGRNHGFGYYG